VSKKIIATSMLAAGLLAGLPAQASVIYTSRSSTITGSSCQLTQVCATQTQSSTDFSPFSGNLSVPTDPNTGSSYAVSQQSTITANTVTVSMSANKQWYDSSSSSFDLHFTVDTPTDFTMSGDIGYWYSSGLAKISLTGPSTFGLDDVSCSVFGNYDSCHYSNHGGVYPSPDSTTTLAPGLYDLLVTALDYGPDYPGGGGPTTANFTMTFAPTVPIPAALWLFVSGLLGLRRWLPKSSVAAAA